MVDPTETYLSIFCVADGVGLGVLDGDGGHREVAHGFLRQLPDTKTFQTLSISQITKATWSKNCSHRALGNNVVEELLVNFASVSLLLEVETKQNSDLGLIGLIVWIHLENKNTSRHLDDNHYWTLIHFSAADLKHAVVAVFLLGEDLQSLLIVTRSDDSIWHLGNSLISDQHPRRSHRPSRVWTHLLLLIWSWQWGRHTRPTRRWNLQKTTFCLSLYVESAWEISFKVQQQVIQPHLCWPLARA